MTFVNIGVRPETKKLLDEVKLHPRVSYDETIRDLIAHKRAGEMKEEGRGGPHTSTIQEESNQV